DAAPGLDLRNCQTGADANARTECRMVLTADALDVYWDGAMAEQAGGSYVMPGFTIFTDAVDTGCGAATSAVGPFYCPADSSVYLDIGFFDQLETQLGAQNAPLAQMYIVAHEWGHHTQHLLGTMSSADTRDTGPTGDAVRLELQADCFAGLFIGAAATTVDPDTAETFLQEPTADQVPTAHSMRRAERWSRTPGPTAVRSSGPAGSPPGTGKAPSRPATPSPSAPRADGASVRPAPGRRR